MDEAGDFVVLYANRPNLLRRQVWLGNSATIDGYADTVIADGDLAAISGLATKLKTDITYYEAP